MSCNPQPCFPKSLVPQVCHSVPLPSLPPAASSTLECLVTCDRATLAVFVPKQSGETALLRRKRDFIF